MMHCSRHRLLLLACTLLVGSVSLLCGGVNLQELVPNNKQPQEWLKWWTRPPPSEGRVDAVHHSPRCCTGEDCLAQDR